MSPAQKALLARLREIVEETPKSGALNAGKRPLYVTRFAQAVERRADDGDALVQYARAKVFEAPTESYTALIEAGHPELTVEAVVADADAEWASEFTDADRTTARERLGEMVAAHERDQEAVEAQAVAHDREIIGRVSATRVTKGLRKLTPEQEADMLSDLAASASAVVERRDSRRAT